MKLKSLIVFDPQDGHLRGKLNFFESLFLIFRSTEITCGITSPALSKKKNFDDLINIDGIGETQINSIKNFFSNSTNLSVLKNLDELLKVKDAEIPKVGGLLNNKTFMFTGKLSNMSRSEA